MDYIVKVSAPYSGIEMNLYKKGLEKLEQTRDGYGESLLDKLFCIVGSLANGSCTWENIENFSEQGKEIWSTYAAVYFPE